MDTNTLQFRFSDGDPAVLEPFTIYFIKTATEQKITVVGGDITKASSVKGSVVIDDFFAKPFKGVGNTALEAIEAIEGMPAPQVIGSGVDLDTLLKPGFYYCGSGSVSQTLSNNPVASAFGLEVINTGGVSNNFSRVRQELVVYTGTGENAVWTRSTAEGTWSSWVQNYRKTQIDAFLAEKVTKTELEALGIQKSVPLTNGTDLNTLTDANVGGIYTISGTYPNAPLAGSQSAMLEVKRHQHDVGTAIVQYYYAANSNVYFRTATFNEVWIWSNWKTVIFSDNAVLTGVTKATVIQEDAVDLGAGSNLDLSTGVVFLKTITAATSLTLSNKPVAGKVSSFVLEITNGGNFAVTWWSGIKWSGGIPPTLSSNGTDAFGFYTTDGGNTWKSTGLDLK